MHQYIFFTDLDGTLLDHHSYSHAPARPALDRLRAAGIPLILNSSKTRAEMEALRTRLDNHDPFIVENGSVICSQVDGETQEEYFGPRYDDLRTRLITLRERFGFQFSGFGDMSNDQVAQATGLAAENAELARRRLSSEPLAWQDTAERLKEFETILHDFDLSLTKGGRFYHVLGKQADKGRALNHLMKQYSRMNPSRSSAGAMRSVALGDSPNDLSMLEAATIPVVIEAASGTRLQLSKPAIFPPGPGPVGWNVAVQNILDDNYQLKNAPN